MYKRDKYRYLKHKFSNLKGDVIMTRDIILEELMHYQFQFEDLSKLNTLIDELVILFQSQEKNKKKIKEKVEEIMILGANETTNFQDKKRKFLSWIDQILWLVG